MKFPKKILLIDHEPGVTRLIRRALERAGKYLIREEHDDKLALNAARWFQPDLILVDTAGQDRRNIEREINSDAALKGTPILSLSNLRPESQMVSGGILSGYSFFAAPIRVGVTIAKSSSASSSMSRVKLSNRIIKPHL
ncbi:MAG: hypothetical protein DME63_02050 [Verrucomicrobia bacterium]|nr:MAG: hypothetical protein DME63_02050 [Verrucomicrobiota bacterium]